MTLGETLKQARESAGLSLENLAILTKVQKKYLVLLESGRYEKLPPPVYLIGFLTRCAKVLNLDSEEIIKQYREERGEPGFANSGGFLGAGTKFHQKIKPQRFRSFAVTPKIFSLFTAVLVFLALSLFFWHQLRFLVAPPKLTLEDPANDFITLDKNLTVKGFSENGAELTINGRRLEIGKDGKFHDYFTLTAGLNLIEIKAVNKFGKEIILTRKIILDK